MSVLRVDGVTVLRGAGRVLDEVDARFAGGRVTAVIGPNGAGKSTLLEVAAGLLSPSKGSVTVDGAALGALDGRDLARIRAYLPQSPRAQWPISVERLVALGLTPHLPAFGPLPPDMPAKVDRALADHDLAGLRGRPATELSGGELARAMLARATVAGPQILIVDEPTAGLDPRHAIAAAKVLRREADRGRAVVMAVHDLGLALRVADDVVALKEGRVLQAGPVGEVVSESLLGVLFDAEVRVIRHEDGLDVRFLF